MGKTFQEIIFDLVRKIPAGQVRTYKELAALAGRPKAYRAVGQILKNNKNDFYSNAFDKIPCHRVIKSNGEVGGYRRGRLKKIKLLKDEGIVVRNNRNRK